ncbi:SDR family NAD(P)-dependent oxidoreductase [Microbacterium abyssi]|uniref:SDR family NAD(P)-dependent oxidoreductase n=1 Tax=Microbacterium abyssi TaxID=2782166 RepID=UPI0022650468|nr:SDR family NAD(P)-dependent oxidoreductase [Microbacterium sp. A18JL241]
MTGASDGVGLEIVRLLADAGAAVIMPVRNRAKGEAAIERIRQAVSDARIVLLNLDLARLDSVDTLTASLREDTAIDICVLNAGVVLLGDRRRHVTADGFELHFQTNFLGHAALIRGILPLLERSQARVVVQTSIAAARARMAWDDLDGARRYRPYRAYASSKLALGLYGLELARRAGGVTVNLSHPGVVPNTAIAAPVRALLPHDLVDWAVRRVGNAPSTAAQTAFDAATSAAGPPVMFAPSGPFGLWGPAVSRTPFRRLLDADEAGRVWSETDRLLS